MLARVRRVWLCHDGLGEASLLRVAFTGALETWQLEIPLTGSPRALCAAFENAGEAIEREMDNAERQTLPQPEVRLDPDQEARAMFVARLQNEQANSMNLHGEAATLTVASVLSLLNDCDRLARSAWLEGDGADR